MFIIDLRNTRVSEYHFSVMNNNDVDEVQIFSHFTQYANYSCYLKVMSDKDEYADKYFIDSAHKEVIDDALICKWLMSKEFTQFKQIRIQLQFENTNGEEIAQSRIIDIILNYSLPTGYDDEKKYSPSIIERLERRIAELEAKVDELEANRYVCY